MITTLDPAANLITACSRCTFDEAQREEVRGLLRRQIDWQRVIRLAEKNYTLPLLFETLNRDASDLIPDWVSKHLHAQNKILKFRAQLFCDELVRLNGVFQAHGISVLHYKGPVCSELLYENAYRRTYLDLDFLVRRTDLDEVCRLLIEQGYQHRSNEDLTAAERDHFESTQKEYAFVSGLICIEPHFSLTAHRYPFPIDYDGLWERAEKCDFAGTQILTFSPRDMLIILSMAGAKGQWKRLQMVTDVAQFYRKMDPALSEPLLRAVRGLGCERILLVAAHLANTLLDAPIPEAIRARIGADGQTVERIARLVIARLFDPEPKPTLLSGSPRLFSPLLFAMRERRRDRLAYLLRTTTTPTRIHFRRVPLPRWAHPAYRVIVPAHDYVAVPLVHAVRNRVRSRERT